MFSENDILGILLNLKILKINLHIILYIILNHKS